MGHLSAHLPQAPHLAISRRGTKCGGAIIEGALNSFNLGRGRADDAPVDLDDAANEHSTFTGVDRPR